MKKILLSIIPLLTLVTALYFNLDAGALIDSTLRVHYIDVGQGDAIFIQTPNGENALIDAGTTAGGRAVMAYLHDLGVETIDYVIATHPHSDHIQGFPLIFDHFEIKSVYAPRISHTTVAFRNFLAAVDRAGLSINTVTPGLELPLIGELNALFVGPTHDYAASALNNWSAVLHITHNENTFILTGDAERTAEMDMIRAYGIDLQSDVLKVSHHGSSTSTIQEFVDVVQPEIAIISVGRNSYGHPAHTVLNRLENAGAEIFRTDLHGTVVVSSDGYNLMIETER